jgi:hypothetical protein
MFRMVVKAEARRCARARLLEKPHKVLKISGLLNANEKLIADGHRSMPVEASIDTPDLHGASDREGPGRGGG